MNISLFKKAFPYIVRTKLTPILVGQHGVGKTQVVRQVAQSYNAKLIDLRLGQMEVGDLMGLAEFMRNPKGEATAVKFIKPDYLPIEGKGILFLDEINRAPKDLHQATFQLILDKRLNGYILPEAKFNEQGEWVDGWVVVAAMNPPTENYVVTDLSDSAYVDRFCFIKFEPSVDEWISYAQQNNFTSTVISLITKEKNILDGKTQDYNLDFVQPSRRSFEEFQRIEAMNPDREVLKAIGKGTIGLEATVMYIKELENNLENISAEQVLKDYKHKKPLITKMAEDNRTDVLNKVITGIVELKKDKTFTKKEVEVTKDLLLTLPKEVAVTFLYALMDNCEELIPSIGNDEDITKHFDDVITNELTG